MRGGLKTEEIHEIIRAHNKARQKVANGHQQAQPSASNMREVVWSSELAIIAQRWAEQCINAKDQNRRTSKLPYSLEKNGMPEKPKTFEHVGQNVFHSHSRTNNPSADVTNVVEAWYNEVEKPGFNASNINPFHFNPSVAHYTQLIWADIDLIGCGFVYFQTSDFTYHKHTICNYASGGNIKDGMMYKVGPQCSNCPKGCSITYPGLCSSAVNASLVNENYQLASSIGNPNKTAVLQLDDEIISENKNESKVITEGGGLKYGLLDNDEGTQDIKNSDPLHVSTEKVVLDLVTEKTNK
uniref:Cysteine-rich venom protein n=1 Tax=Strigamia maritima TaxID=126957 RepID=T1JFC9_STRMM